MFSRLTSLQMKILLVFVCENHSVVHPKIPFASPFFPFGAYSSINTHRLSSARTVQPVFGSFVFRIETNFPAKQSSSNKNPPRIHNHLFSRKIQKQRSEQPSLCLGYDGESILRVLLKSERELRWKQFNAFSRPAI